MSLYCVFIVRYVGPTPFPARFTRPRFTPFPRFPRRIESGPFQPFNHRNLFFSIFSTCQVIYNISVIYCKLLKVLPFCRPAALLPPFFNDVAGEAVNADCRRVVWLYGKVETVELFLDIEVPVSAVSPCPHVKGGKTENGVPAGGQTVGFDVEYKEPDSHGLAI